MDLRSSNRFNVISLCSGGAGLELGLKLADRRARTVCYVEREAFAIAVLVQRMREKALDEAPVWTDLKSFDGKPWRGKVDCITGGYPCQPFSGMGLRQSEKDPRHLWPYIRDIIRDVEPSLVFFENVSNHLNLGFDTVRRELQELGFQVEAGLFGADEIGGRHHRKRLYILGYAKGRGWGWNREQEEESQIQTGGHDSGVGSGKHDVRLRLKSLRYDGSVPLFPPGPSSQELEEWRETIEQRPEYCPCYKPKVFRVVDELACCVDKSDPEGRQDQVRLLGNGVVPACAAYAFGILSSEIRKTEDEEEKKISG